MAYALRRPQFPRRSPLLGLIVLMHAVVVYYINAGMKIAIPIPEGPFTMVDIAPDLTKAARLNPVKPDVPAPKTTEVEPPPLPPIEIAAEPPAAERDPLQMTGTHDSSGNQDSSPTMDPRHPLGKPEYPPQAIRAEQEGLVVVSACVQPTGRLTDILVSRSSGFALLDTAAVNHLARPFVRMRPGMANGEPVAQCVGVPIRFSLRDR